jgi:hypothetical protein
VYAAITSLALASGLAFGCLVELPRGRSCGDGWWDPEYEQCDPSSSDRSYLTDAMKCSSGADALRCTDQCTLEPVQCPAVCGDGIVDPPHEECDPGLACVDDEDCGPGRVCYPLLAECIPDSGYGPNLECSNYATEAVPIDKPYASGIIDRCTDYCLFSRSKCSFCGDGERDDGYSDHVFPQGGPAQFPAEICDGDEVLPDVLEAHCEALCVSDQAINADVVVHCAFECNADCDGFEQAVNPGDPDGRDCCLAKGSPCPTMDLAGVPDLPCCSWAEHPEWSCVQGEAKEVCP